MAGFRLTGRVLDLRSRDGCDFQQCGILTSENYDEPVQHPFKLRNSKWYSVSNLTLIE